MMNDFDNAILNMAQTTPEPEDYTGEDGLLYCGKCRKPKEAYFPKESAAWLRRDRHPAECDCQRAERERREAAEKQRSHREAVERLKRQGSLPTRLCRNGRLKTTTANAPKWDTPVSMWRTGKP